MWIKCQLQIAVLLFITRSRLIEELMEQEGAARSKQEVHRFQFATK